MDSGPSVVDLSSDDDDHDWVSELLEEMERQGDDEDGSDDVVLINPKQTEGLDDDCVILDGDPEKVDVVEGNAGGESDDLLVVGEKGQIACRDYPHSRHLCANFPFTCSPHDKHCHQCHCYVCDLVAPCVHWGNGTSSIDHCHANDKDEFWIYQRQYSKQGDKVPLPVHKFSDTSPLVLPQQNQCPTLAWLPPDCAALNEIFSPTAIHAYTTQQNQCPTLNLPTPDSATLNQIFEPTTIHACTAQQNQCATLNWLTPDSAAALNQIFRPTTIPACTTSTSFGIPNITSQGRSQQYAHVLSRNKYQPHLVSQHLLSAQNDFIKGGARHSSGNLGPQIINSPKVFKRAGSRDALTTNQSGYGSLYNDLLTQDFGNAAGAAASHNQNPPRWQGFPNRTTSKQNAYHPPSHQHMPSVFVNYVPPQTQVYSQPIPAISGTQVGFQQVNEHFSAVDQQFSEVDTSWILKYQSAFGALEDLEPSGLNT